MERKLNFRNPAALSALVKGDIENALIAATPGGIEAQEAQGQAQFVHSTSLPIECTNATHADLEALGIRFHENIDHLFVHVTLPEGWKKVATEHSMWSDLLDEYGRKRASMFYKAAFYDRHATMHLRWYYNIEDVYDDNLEGPHTRVIVITTGEGERIKTSPVISCKDFASGDKIREEYRAWLTATFPDWESPLAYWHK